MDNKKYLKIASQIYTYLKEAVQEENTPNITFQQLKTDILGKRDQIASNKIKALSSTMNTNDFNSFINKTDSKGYTLLMLAASNNLKKTVTQLVINGADTSITIKVTGDLFRRLLNYKIKYNLITEEEINELKEKKSYDAMAIDIAQSKNYNEIINILQ